MIDLRKRLIVRDDKEELIDAFLVMWRGPAGLYNDLELAVKICREHDLEPELCLRPVVVAKSISMQEEM